jgi:hypothetical protein
MIRFVFLFALAMGFLPLPVTAAELVISEDLFVEIPLREGWTLHLEPPEALVLEMAAHVAHEPAAANASAAQIEKVTRNRMAANEAFVYHAASGAHLEIDFSPLEQGASAPSTKTLRTSAEYAAQSLEGEEGVSNVAWDVIPVKIQGAREAFQLVADYQRHDLPVKFVGTIGYVEGYWLFLYFTDPSQKPEVFEQMQEMLGKLVVRHSSH